MLHYHPQRNGQRQLKQRDTGELQLSKPIRIRRNDRCVIVLTHWPAATGEAAPPRTKAGQKGGPGRRHARSAPGAILFKPFEPSNDRGFANPLVIRPDYAARSKGRSCGRSDREESRFACLRVSEPREPQCNLPAVQCDFIVIFLWPHRERWLTR